MEVDLRSVESTVTLIDYIVHSQCIQCFSERFCSQIPVFIASHAVFRSCRKFYMIFEAKQLVYFIDQKRNTLDLIFHLFRCHKDMCIVLCEAAHSHQSVHLSGFLVAVYNTKFSHTKRKVTVGTRF